MKRLLIGLGLAALLVLAGCSGHVESCSTSVDLSDHNDVAEINVDGEASNVQEGTTIEVKLVAGDRVVDTATIIVHESTRSFSFGPSFVVEWSEVEGKFITSKCTLHR